MDANDVIAKMMDRLIELEKKDNSNVDMTEEEMDELVDLALAIDVYHDWSEKLSSIPRRGGRVTNDENIDLL